ncbi:cytochrome P450 [Mycena capillaripes]|nr:cytochrome P450 [Mycena capillaripes]
MEVVKRHPILAALSGIILLAIPLYHLSRNRHHKVKALHDKYGRVVQTGPNTVSFLSSSAIRQIYNSSNALDKTTAYDVQHLQGEGLFFIKDKATHNCRRRIWNRSFSEQALLQYHDHLVVEAQRLIHWLLKRTADNGQVDLVRILPQYSFDSINAVFFSGNAFPSLLDSDDPAQIAPEASKFFALSEVLTHIEPLFHLAMYIPGISMFMGFEKLSINAALKRLKNGPTFQDGISHWLDGDESQPKLDPSDLPIEAETILIGGADTIGGVAVFVLYFLLANPRWMALLRQELDNHAEEQALDYRLRSLDELPILNSVIQESLRLGTPLPGLPRIVPEGGIIIDGHHVPSGTVVNVPVWAYHLDEEYFPNATAFDPGRWIEDGKFSPAKTSLLVFGGGPFNCVGQKLVFVQFRIMIATLVLELEVTPAPGFNAVKFWDGIRNRRTTTFSTPFPVRVTRRIE